MIDLSGMSTSDPLQNQLADLDRLTAAIKRYFYERMGQREIDTELFYEDRAEHRSDPELVAIACALFGAESHEELFFNTLHEKRDADTQALANIVKAMAVAFEQAKDGEL